MPAKEGAKRLGKLGDYKLLRQLGEGCMGTVYEAQQIHTQDIVAIKQIAPGVAKNATLLKRFEQEFRLASKLDHPNIVRVLDYCDKEKTPYLVMEFVQGESVAGMLKIDRMTEPEAIHVIVQVCHGLHWAHCQGLIHRDIKPDNIMVTQDGVAKIMDLGLAKQVDATANLTVAGHGLGTPNYMAPEQFRDAKNAGVRCDIYSLGATLYEMVTGQTPFAAKEPLQIMVNKLQGVIAPPRSVVSGLSNRLDRAIMRAIQINPQDRPATCLEFVEDLTGESLRLPPPAAAEDPWFLTYPESDGRVCLIRGSADAVRKAIRTTQTAVRPAMRVGRSQTGPFLAVDAYPELAGVESESAADAEETSEVAPPPSEARPEPAADSSPEVRVEETTETSTEKQPAQTTTSLPSRPRKPGLASPPKPRSRKKKRKSARKDLWRRLFVIIAGALAFGLGLWLFLGK